MLKEVQWHEAVTTASPYPYVLVTSIDKDGRPNAMGVAWWSFTSLAPPLIMVSIGKERYTLDCIRNTGDFTVSFPSEEIAGGAWMCGKKSGRGIDKLKEAKLSTVASGKVTSPIIEGSTVAFECKVISEVESGDHIVFFAEIVGTWEDVEKPMHLYSVFYTKLLSMDTKGNINFTLKG